MKTRPEAASADLDASACWEVVERVSASAPLKRAARLREFLEYVGRKSLQEGRSDVHEQEIGEVVFGRSEGYDTGQDNIVRVSATELRKRIDAYFESEGRDEPLIFEIPRGSYTPLFRRRESGVEAAPAMEAEPPAPAVHLTGGGVASAGRADLDRYRLGLLLVSLLALVLAIVCGWLWRQNQILRQQLVVRPGVADRLR